MRRVPPRRFARQAFGAVLVALWFGVPDAARACAFQDAHPQEPGARALDLPALPEGITRAWFGCAGEAHPVVVWTLAVDDASAEIGVRDGPLFRDVPKNPMVAIGAAGAPGGTRLTVFQRRETAPWPRPGDADRRPPFRLFGTICDAASPAPLDCWAGRIRVKARVDAEDRDRDGTLDNNRHQLSIFHAGRLQVLTFNRPHAATPLAAGGYWIEALGVAGLL